MGRRRYLRVVIGAALTLTASVLRPTSALGSPTLSIDSMTTTAGTFAPYTDAYGYVDRFAAGHESNPQLSISGASPGEHLTIRAEGGSYYGTGNVVDLAACDVTASTVVVNGSTTGCATPATFALPDGDGSTFLYVSDGTTDTQSWWYFRDNSAPYAPLASVTGAPAAGGISVGWHWASPEDPPPGSAVRDQVLYRSAADPAGPENTTWSPLVVLDVRPRLGGTACSFDQVEHCRYLDHPPPGHRYLYRVTAVDLAANVSAPSPSLPATGPDAQQGVLARPDQPTIASVAGTATSPASGAGSRPAIVTRVGADGGTLTLASDGTPVVAKSFAPGQSSVAIGSADYQTPIGPRGHSFTAIVSINGVASTASAPFTYFRPPAPPVIVQVAGQARPARGTSAHPAVQVAGTQAGDAVRLYADDDCGGPHQPAAVGSNDNAPGATTIVSSYSADLALGTTCLSVTTTDPANGDTATATSNRSTSFAYERKRAVRGFGLGSHGTVRGVDTGSPLPGSPSFGPALARRLVSTPDGAGGFVLDGYGGLHPLALLGASAPAAPSGAPYFGFDIGRAVALVTASSGYVLDGYGGVHAFGGAPAAAGAPYFGWDIARDLVLLPDGSGGYVLDGRGGIHGFTTGANPKPVIGTGSPTFTWDIARRMVLRTATSGYLLDGFGGVHAFGGAPSAPSAGYHGGVDSARAMTMTELDGNGGYIAEASGIVNIWGDALPQPSVAFPGDTVRDALFLAIP